MIDERKGFTVDSSGSTEEIPAPQPIKGEHSLPKGRGRRGILHLAGDRTEEIDTTGKLVTLENKRQFYIDDTGTRVFDVASQTWHEIAEGETTDDIIDRLSSSNT